MNESAAAPAAAPAAPEPPKVAAAVTPIAAAAPAPPPTPAPPVAEMASMATGDPLECHKGKVFCRLIPPHPQALETCCTPLRTHSRCSPAVGQCIVLFTSYASNQLFEVAWRKIETQLQSKGVDYVPIDGAAPDNKELRSALWAISGQRTYPQVFIYDADACNFVGGGDEVQELFDAGGYTRVFSDYLGKKNWEPGTPRGEM